MEPLDDVACVVSPNRADAELAVRFLAQNGIRSRSFSGLRDLAGVIEESIGCIVIVDEALDLEEILSLREALQRLPAWADVPLIVIAADVAAAGLVARDAFPTSGNVTLLERPLNPHTLVSSVQVALRATARQREVGALIRERERAVHARDEFLAMLAHELRNPLAPMRNALYLMGRRGIEDDVVVKGIAILERQLMHLVRLVDDLIDVARLERRKVRLQKKRLDLNRVVATAVEGCFDVDPQRRRRVTVQFSTDALPVFADGVRIEQVVSNLVNNALKFSTAPQEVRVETARNGDRGVLIVADEGIGFEPTRGESLFAPFLQVNPTIERGRGGLGIGLTIVRRLVELHDGTVRAQSEGPGRGARFVVTIPLASADVEPADTSDASARDTRPLRIAVIEDNLDIQETLRMLLTEWGHSVVVAGDGPSGVETVLSTRPDVALIDIGLPRMNGYEVARAIRSHVPHGAIRLIALTGYGQAADRSRALAAGFESHLLKPVAPDILERALTQGALPRDERIT